VDYPDYNEITDPRPTLPPEIRSALEPWFESAQRSYRHFRQRFRKDFTIWEEEHQLVIGHASDVFCVQVVLLMKNRPSEFEEFRNALSLDTGTGDTAHRYAHFLYRDVHGASPACWGCGIATFVTG
jgi:hypothetical protein